MSLNETPGANRLHIGVFGRANSGKSSFINAFTGQNVSIVSDVAGTTTDAVTKAMEIHPLGPCVLIDTAGFDDTTILGEVRKEKTRIAAEKCDIAVILFTVSTNYDISEEKTWYSYFSKKNTPVLAIVNKIDIAADDAFIEAVRKVTKEEPLLISAKTGEGIEKVKEALARKIPEDFAARSITGDLVSESDVVMLVMPQDIQAPKGRLILPQVQTIRELLDKKCIVMSVTTDKMTQALEQLKQPPKLIITDSQVFRMVYEQKPAESMLTSFSVLFAAYKGDLPYYIEGAKQIERLSEQSKVLIAECCTHAPLSEDIGRVKIPAMLKKRFGAGLTVDIVSGTDFPEDLSEYDLIIQCGGCMFNRKYIMSRIERAKKQQISMTNYGVTIAHLTGILDKISVTSHKVTGNKRKDRIAAKEGTMTLRECYEKMDGNYEDVISRLTKEERIAKYTIKFLEDSTFKALCEAREANNHEAVFREIHTLKGLSENLGFAKLYEACHKMTEAVRGGVELQEESLFEAVRDVYFETIDVIREYADSIEK